MSHDREQLERLVGRALDGELTAEQRAELDRELLSNPAARELYDACSAIDALAADVIRESTSRRLPRLVCPAPAVQRKAPISRRSAWMLAGSALAACLALVVFLKTPAAPRRDDPVVAENAGAVNTLPASQNHGNIRPRIGAPGEAGVWQVVDQPAPQIDRTTDRNLLFLQDEQGNIYLLNVDLIREVESNRDERGLRFVKDPV